jgi:hypothetical protein
MVEVIGGAALDSTATAVLVWLQSGVRPPVTVERRGSRGICRTQSSGAFFADTLVGIEEGKGMAGAVNGVDPHKRSATIGIFNEREQAARTRTLRHRSRRRKAMLAAGRKHEDRVGRRGLQRLRRTRRPVLGRRRQTVVDVAAKLLARARILSTGQ